MSDTALLTADGHAIDGVGFLTQQDHNRFMWAWDKAPSIIRWLMSADARGVNTASADDVRVDSSNAPTINLSPAWLLGDELNSLMTEIERHPAGLDQIANDPHGAKLARTFGRKVSGADHAYPQEEKPHFVRHMTCGGCEQLTLTFRPPRWAGDAIKVDCWCGYELTQAQFALAALIIERDLMEAAA